MSHFPLQRAHLDIAALAVGGVTLLFALVVCYALCGTYASDEERIVCISSAGSADSVRVELETASGGLRRTAFSLMARCSGLYGHLKPGRYDIGSGHSAVAVFRRLHGGEETPVRLTIPSVRTVADLACHLDRKLMADSASFAAALTDSALLAAHGVKPETAMCLFLANTYEVYWTVTPEKLLDRMSREYDTFWTKERTAKLDDVRPGFTREEAITLASIVECETTNSAERPRVAGLYINRLRQGIRLQADPTVKFALGDFALRRILLQHLSADSPYNTYRVEGLPPGPICIPSLESIDAVLNYERHNYIYMCAKEDFSGTHNFAATDVEHALNAARYQRALNERGIKQ